MISSWHFKVGQKKKKKKKGKKKERKKEELLSIQTSICFRPISDSLMNLYKKETEMPRGLPLSWGNTASSFEWSSIPSAVVNEIKVELLVL